MEKQLEGPEGIHRRLDPCEQAVERRHVASDRICTEGVRLDERRPRTDEWVIHATPGREIPLEEHLDQLRDVLSKVRVQLVDMLGALRLGEIRLRPRKLQVDLGVER